MFIAADKIGNQLLKLIQGNEDELIANESHRPFTGSLVIIKSPKGFMLLKNKYRQTWEIAGGAIDQGETARECAVRECFEESGYEIKMSDLRFVGLLKCFLTSGYVAKGIDYSALYCADIQNIKEFHENEEMSDLCWYNLGEPIEDVNEIDIKLLEYYL